MGYDGFAEWVAPNELTTEQPMILQSRLLRNLAVCLASAVWLPELPAQEPPQLEIAGDQVEVVLSQSSAPDELLRLEFSEDLVHWQPLARRYGGLWEPLFPDPRTILSGPSGETIIDPIAGRPRYFLRYDKATAGTLSDAAQAARFLQQATFGPKLEEITTLAASNDYEAWIDAQIALPPTSHLALWQDNPFEAGIGKQHQMGSLWMLGILDSPDQLRQRMAWALSQIFVIGTANSNEPNEAEQWTNYYDILVRNAFGNFRDLLQEVTLSPKMGEYLTYQDNAKARGDVKPDENYAREVMQLFTIGLVELNLDGSAKKDAHGDLIATYDNTDIETNARVFTGLVHAPQRPEDIADGKRNRFDPMVTDEDQHDVDEKVLLDGAILPAGLSTMEDVDGLLDRLFLHPNTPPFICRLLIQRLTGSNPSPAYIERVAQKFVDNGSGERGDLAAVIKAILLDPEARDPVLSEDDGHGALREPILRFTHYCRAFGLTSSRSDGHYRIRSLLDDFKQFPYESPSVFNFYLPDHQPQGIIFERQLFAPEFQILDSPSAVRHHNVLIELVETGLGSIIAERNNPSGTLDLSTEIALADDVDELLDHLDLLLTADRLTDASRAIIRDAVIQIPGSDAEARVHRALILFAVTPEFSVFH